MPGLKLFLGSVGIMALLFLSDHCKSQNWEWATKLDGPEEDRCYTFTMDSSKNSYMSGIFRNALNSCYSGHPNANGFIAKLDSSGNYKWCSWFGGNLFTIPNSIAYESTGFLYVTGWFNDTAIFGTDTLIAEWKDIFVSKVDTNGNFIWTKRAGGQYDDQGNTICVQNDGIILSGSFRDTANFGLQQVVSTGNSDLFVAKYDWNGNCLWVRSGGGNGDDSGKSIYPGFGNKVFVGAEFSSIADFGLQTITSVGNNDVVILEIDSLGNMQVITNYGGSGTDQIFDLRIDFAGNIYTTGFFENICYVNGDSMISAGLKDIYIFKFDTSGNLIYNFTGGGPNIEIGRSLAVNDQAEVFATGDFSGTAVFDTVTINPIGTDIYLLKLDANGQLKWITGTPATLSTVVNPARIEVDNMDNCFVAGTFRYYAYFGNFLLYAGLKTNPFLFKYNPTLSTGTETTINDNFTLEIYPSPFSDLFTINTKILSQINFILYDITGRAVVRKSFKGSTSFDGSFLPAGIYFYELSNTIGKLKQGKIIKM